MKTFKIHLIRHGLTQGNLDGIYMGGGIDQPLCPEGEAQIRDLAARFSYPAVGLVFASPMLRALQTADILYPVVADRMVLEDLRENRFGEFEGRKAEELAGSERFRQWLDPESDFVPAGGESGRDFARRTARAMVAMLHHMMNNNISQAACVTHGGVIMSMLSQMALPRKPSLEWMADNGCGFTVQSTTAMLMRDGMVEAVEIVPEGYLEYLAARESAAAED